MKTPKKEGFTLIELLVVIAIIGILSSVVLVSLDQARARARFSTMVSQIQQIRTAAEVYHTSNGHYPGDITRGRDPGLVGEYLPAWPEPPCDNYEYDWENWDTPPNADNGNIVRVSIRDLSRNSGYSVLYACMKPNNEGICTNGGNHEGEDITTTDISALHC